MRYRIQKAFFAGLYWDRRHIKRWYIFDNFTTKSKVNERLRNKKKIQYSFVYIRFTSDAIFLETAHVKKVDGAMTRWCDKDGAIEHRSLHPHRTIVIVSWHHRYCTVAASRHRHRTIDPNPIVERCDSQLRVPFQFPKFPIIHCHKKAVLWSRFFCSLIGEFEFNFHSYSLSYKYVFLWFSFNQFLSLIKKV